VLSFQCIEKKKMRFIQTDIPDIILIEPHVLSDTRGFFLESYQAKRFAKAGIKASFVQDNHSSSEQGVLRGLHYQIQQAQGKLVRVIYGDIYDVAVDLRRSSPTFGQWIGAHLSAENKHQLWIPPSFAHGYYVLSEHAEVLYKATDYYAPEWERMLLWNDPKLGVQWPLIEGLSPILSEKDAHGTLLADAECFE
jgi:dTDP-4-dehydrorhamnose 3,5-epimerase